MIVSFPEAPVGHIFLSACSWSLGWSPSPAFHWLPIALWSEREAGRMRVPCWLYWELSLWGEGPQDCGGGRGGGRGQAGSLLAVAPKQRSTLYFNESLRTHSFVWYLWLTFLPRNAGLFLEDGSSLFSEKSLRNFSKRCSVLPTCSTFCLRPIYLGTVPQQLFFTGYQETELPWFSSARAIWMIKIF